MRRLILLLLLIGCGTQTKLEGCPECYACGGAYCLDVQIDGHEVRCLYDTGAAHSVWISDELALQWGLTPIWTQEAEQQYGSGTVPVTLYDVRVCHGQDCDQMGVYSVEMQNDCLYGLI